MTGPLVDDNQPDDRETPTQAAVRYALAGMRVFPIDMRPDAHGQPRKTPLYAYGWKQRATSNVHDVIEDFTNAEHDIGIDSVGVGWALGLDGDLAVDQDHEQPPRLSVFGFGRRVVTPRSESLCTSEKERAESGR